MEEVQRYFQENEKEAVESCMTIAGIGFSGRAQNNGMVFIRLKDWKLRDRPDLKVKAVAGRAMRAFSQIRNALVFAFPPPVGRASWATPPGSTSSCWTGAGSATRS